MRICKGLYQYKDKYHEGVYRVEQHVERGLWHLFYVNRLDEHEYQNSYVTKRDAKEAMFRVMEATKDIE